MKSYHDRFHHCFLSFWNCIPIESFNVYTVQQSQEEILFSSKQEELGSEILVLEETRKPDKYAPVCTDTFNKSEYQACHKGW